MKTRAGGMPVRNSLMEIFRIANEERDARRRVEVTDETGGRIVPGRRLQQRASVNSADLQRSVGHDLERLMNVVHLAADLDLEDFPEARRSILNHGFVDIARMTLDDGAVTGIAAEIETALRTFEPRLAPDSIMARRDLDVDPAELTLRFLVRAEIRADPLNVPVEFVADLDRDTGRMKVARR